MDTNKKILIGTVGTAIVIGGAAIGLILSRAPEKTGLSTVHTETATEAPEETLPATTRVQEIKETAEFQESAASSVSTLTETYTFGKISIQYPVMDQLDDTPKKDKINESLEANVLSVIEADDIDEANDTLDIKRRVISVDRKRLTVTHAGMLSTKGAAHPVNLLYSNTVNLPQAQSLGSGDFTDAYTVARYVLSDGVKFSGISSDVEAQVLSCHSFMDSDSLTAAFSSTDFFLSSEIQWPESFSYGSQGTIYFSLPVFHTLGNYVPVVFNPTTKQSFYQDLPCADFKTRSGVDIIRYLMHNYRQF